MLSVIAASRARFSVTNLYILHHWRTVIVHVRAKYHAVVRPVYWPVWIRIARGALSPEQEKEAFFRVPDSGTGAGQVIARDGQNIALNEDRRAN
jgi:hypothetical protein